MFLILWWQGGGCLVPQPAAWVLFFSRHKLGFTCTSMIFRRHSSSSCVSYQSLLSYWQPNWSVKHRWAGRWGRGRYARCVSTCLVSKWLQSFLSVSCWFFFFCRKKSSHVIDMPIARKKHELLYVAWVIHRLSVKCLRLVDLSVTNNGTTCGLTLCNVDD